MFCILFFLKDSHSHGSYKLDTNCGRQEQGVGIDARRTAPSLLRPRAFDTLSRHDASVMLALVIHTGLVYIERQLCRDWVAN